MRTFLASFLNEDWSDRPAGPRVHLGVFGKHPGWDDHFDLGLDTQSLVVLKRMLYTQGIATEIEAQSWEKLPEADRLPDFDHWFIWLRPTESLIGRIWSSTDGKGRAHYPMVVAAHLAGLPLSWGLKHVFPLLEQATEAFRISTTSGRVVSTVMDVLDDLRNAAAGFHEKSCTAGLVGTAGIAHLTAMLRDNPDYLYPLYEHIYDRFRTCSPGLCNYASEFARMPSQSLRVPASGAGVKHNLNAWLGFLLTEIDPATPTLAIMREGGEWVDLVAGEPSRGAFHLLRANKTVMPVVTSQPASHSAQMDSLVVRKRTQFESGELSSFSLFNNQTPSRNLQDATTRLNAVKSSGRGLFWRIFGSASGRLNVPFARD